MKISKKLAAASIIALFATTFATGSALASDGNDISAAASGQSNNGFLHSSFASFAQLFHSKDSKSQDTNNSNHGKYDRANIVKVTSVNGNTIEGDTIIGKEAGDHWVIDVNDNTLFFGRTGDKESISDVKVGDTITFHGSIIPSSLQPGSGGSPYRVMANRIKVWGDVDVSNTARIQNATVTNVNDDNMSLTVTTSDGQEITLLGTDHTKVVSDVNGSSTPSTFSNIEDGMTISFKGFWNSLKNSVTALRIKIMGPSVSANS